MRLKCLTSDFQVREQLTFTENPGGQHFVHLLRKEKLSTPEALSMIVRDGNVERGSISYAGLKDRQAVTEQFISIPDRAVDIDRPGLRVRCIGRTDRPITSRMSSGNAFTIVVRDLAPAQAASLRRNMPSLVKTGFPNYFDDQRFGCLRHGQGFAMLHVLRGDHEEALHSLVAEPSEVAISGDIRLKRALRARWGDWDACMEIVRGPVYEPVFQHLQRTRNDFRGAIELLPQRMRVIHAFAFQSFLWNRALSRMVWPWIASAQRLRITTLAGALVAWKYLDPRREEELVKMETPLYGPEGAGGGAPFRAAMEGELAHSGLRRDDFLANAVPGMIWKEEPRDALVKPMDMAEPKLAPDDMHRGKMMAVLEFRLPRGAYATMLLKRMFAQPWYERGSDERDGRGFEAESEQGESRGPQRGGRGDRRPEPRGGMRRPTRGPSRPRDNYVPRPESPPVGLPPQAPQDRGPLRDDRDVRGGGGRGGYDRGPRGGGGGRGGFDRGPGPRGPGGRGPRDDRGAGPRGPVPDTNAPAPFTPDEEDFEP